MARKISGEYDRLDECLDLWSTTRLSLIQAAVVLASIVSTSMVNFEPIQNWSESMCSQPFPRVSGGHQAAVNAICQSARKTNDNLRQRKKEY